MPMRSLYSFNDSVTKVWSDIGLGLDLVRILVCALVYIGDEDYFVDNGGGDCR